MPCVIQGSDGFVPMDRWGTYCSMPLCRALLKFSQSELTDLSSQVDKKDFLIHFLFSSFLTVNILKLMQYVLLLNLLRHEYFSATHYYFCFQFSVPCVPFLHIVLKSIHAVVFLEQSLGLWGIGASAVVGSQFHACQNSECFCITPTEIFRFLPEKLS